MPIYEYKCKSCGSVSEFLESSNNTDKHDCPECGKPGMERIFSAFGVEMGHSSPPPTGGCAGGSCAGGTCPFN